MATDVNDEARNLNLSEEFPPPGRDEWRATVEKDLKGADFDKKLVRTTIDGLKVQPLYTSADCPEELLGRTAFARDSSGKPWQVAQEITSSSPEEANAILRKWLNQELAPIAVRLDEATRRGYGPDEEEAASLIGKNGTAICSITCLRKLLDGVDFEAVPITLRAGAGAFGVLAMLLALVEERGFYLRALKGSLDFDPIAQLATNGTLREPLGFHYQCAADMVKLCAEKCPSLRPMTVHGAKWQAAGASGVEELACVLATGAEYLRELVNRGIDPADAAMAMTFSFPVTPSLFPEIAKLRAARGLWAKIVCAFGVGSADAQRTFLHVHGSRWAKSRYDVHSNLVRSSIEAFAAATGGADSMSVEPFDSTLGPESEFALRLARNQQFLLREESYLSAVTDPGGGSWYIESLTDSMAREAWKSFQEIEGEGGISAALMSGFVQGRIAKTRERRDGQMRSRRAAVVGVSHFPNLKEAQPTCRTTIQDSEFRLAERQAVEHLKSVRDDMRLKVSLSELAHRWKTDEGFYLEVAVDAAREGATVGEILQAMLASESRECEQCTPLPQYRAADSIEALRDRAAGIASTRGHAPKALLVPVGEAAMRLARVMFSTDFLGVGGFECEVPPPFDNAAAAAAAINASDADVAVLCGDDAGYPAMLAEILASLGNNSETPPLYVAGKPFEVSGGIKPAGFINMQSDVVSVMDQLLNMVEGNLR